MHANNRHEQLKESLQARFESHMHRHENLTWATINEKLSDDVLKVLAAMEQTGGEPDATYLQGAMCFVDFSSRHPKVA